VIQRLAPDDRILVRLPSWLGDLVMAEPALGALVHAVGAERVSIAAPAHLLPVLEGMYPGVRRLAHAGRGGEGAGDWQGHDVALLFTNSFRSAWVAWRSGIRRRVGWSRDWRAALLTDALGPALERGATPFGLGKPGRGRRYLPRPFGASCLELLGRLGISVARTRPRLSASSEGERLAAARLQGFGLARGAPYFLASVGAREHSAKAYPSESWVRVFDRLADRAASSGAQILPLLLLVGPGEETLLKPLLDRSKHPKLFGVADPVALLPELLALAAGARHAWVADGGARHVIAASGTPLTWVAGPSDPRHTADHLEAQTLLRVELPCGPCHRERCSETGEGEHACMRRIEPVAFADSGVRALS